MVKISMAAKQQKEQKYTVCKYTCCEHCGRPYPVYRKFKLCRICFHKLAYKGQILGVRKASW